jgi:aspartyl aminopeptidase
MDLKPAPLYEDSELAYLKTHYYGGIRKYQWVTIPLALHGVVIRKDGTKVTVRIGEEEGEPRLVITDLLPHLGAAQNKKPLAEAVPGETLNLLLGSEPIGNEEESGRVKLAVMKLLHEKYGIVEDDLTSAELEAVPAVKACDIGLDRSLIGAYGHDDRVCAYAALKALLDLEETPVKTAVCILADKEEIGSDGVTGMQSAAFDTFIEDLCAAQGAALRTCFAKSFCLSADVTAAYDPNYPDVFEKRNESQLNYGVGLCKYTGARGKSGASDADAETVAYVRRLFDQAGVIWQISELGKVDAGGGGTVAMYMANRNISTLDAGVPVLSMHAPFETVSKLDCYETYKGMRAVFQAKE